MVLSACRGEAPATPDQATIIPSQRSQATSPALFGTQPLTKNTATLLPPIPATPNERTPSPLGVTAAQLQGLQVTLWYPWLGATGLTFQSIVDEFNHTNQWGIRVDATGYQDFGSLDDALEAAFASGGPPDVLVDYGYQARHFEASGVLADLTPYVNDPVWGLNSGEQADFYSTFWAEDQLISATATQPGRLGVPYYRSAYALFYNQSWAEQLGYPDPPATPEDFRTRACAAAEAVRTAGDKTALGHGGWLITPGPEALSGWIYAFGGNITTPDGAGYQFNTPATSQAFTFLKGLQESGCAWTSSDMDGLAAFASRQALFVVGSLVDIPAQRAAFATAGSSDNWVVIPFPSSSQPLVETYGPSIFITKSSAARQLAAWLVIEWLVYPPNQAGVVQQLGVYPTRRSTLSYLTHTEQAGTQWAQALGFLPDARPEPTLASWSVMRWALSDASSQLFSQAFGTAQIPTLIGNLDSVGQEIISQAH